MLLDTLRMHLGTSRMFLGSKKVIFAQKKYGSFKNYRIYISSEKFKPVTGMIYK